MFGKAVLTVIGVLKPVLPEVSFAVCYPASPPSSQGTGIQVLAWQTLKLVFSDTQHSKIPTFSKHRLLLSSSSIASVYVHV